MWWLLLESPPFPQPVDLVTMATCVDPEKKDVIVIKCHNPQEPKQPSCGPIWVHEDPWRGVCLSYSAVWLRAHGQLKGAWAWGRGAVGSSLFSGTGREDGRAGQ